MEVKDFKHIRYELPADGVARIVMARPPVRNAQDLLMTYELNAAFDRAVGDESVRVIILAGDDPHFSSGHDLGQDFDAEFPRVGTWGRCSDDGVEGFFADEMEIYVEMCERWRNLSKPTIALVQGKCIAGGLMLAWACDLIIASDDASFRDPTIDMGIMGVEFFMHPWELGIRQAKEFLFTTEWLEAGRAKEFGMINRVVPRDNLMDEGLSLAKTIASKPTLAVRTAKVAVNNAQDMMGRSQSMRHSIALHHLTHADNQLKYGMMFNPEYMNSSKAGNKMKDWKRREGASVPQSADKVAPSQAKKYK